MAELAKQIIAHYYGQPARYSYFAGCSTGGREAMLMTQRYPAEFDGVISGDPAMRTGFSQIGNNWSAGRLQPDCSQRRLRKAAAEQSVFRERHQIDRQRES